MHVSGTPAAAYPDAHLVINLNKPCAVTDALAASVAACTQCRYWYSWMSSWDFMSSRNYAPQRVQVMPMYLYI